MHICDEIAVYDLLAAVVDRAWRDTRSKQQTPAADGRRRDAVEFLRYLHQEGSGDSRTRERSQAAATASISCTSRTKPMRTPHRRSVTGQKD